MEEIDVCEDIVLKGCREFVAMFGVEGCFFATMQLPTTGIHFPWPDGKVLSVVNGNFKFNLKLKSKFVRTRQFGTATGLYFLYTSTWT